MIKVVWGREWDALLHADSGGALVNLMNTTPDGDYQTYRANNGAYVREHFFGRDPAPRPWCRTSPTPTSGTSSAAVTTIARSTPPTGPDGTQGQPTVILAKTIRATPWAPTSRGRNATHQMKKLALQTSKFRDAIPHPDHRCPARGEVPTCRRITTPGPGGPGDPLSAGSAETLGGFVPHRRAPDALTLPPRDVYKH